MIKQYLPKNLLKNLSENVYDKKKNLIALIFIILCYFPFMGDSPVPLNIAMIILIIVSLMREFKPFVISKFISYFLIISSVVFVFSLYGKILGLKPSLAILSLLTILKFLELNTKRDYFIFIFMSQLLLVGQLLLMDSLLFVFYLMMMSFLFFYLMLHVSSDDKNEKHQKSRVTILYKCFFIAIPLSVILFFFFPRVIIGNIFLKDLKKQSTTGFVSELNPGEYSKVVRDKNPIFRASFSSNVRPLARELYWRGAVLGENVGFKWLKISFRKPQQKKQQKKQRSDNISNNNLDNNRSKYIYNVDFVDGIGSGVSGDDEERKYIFTLPRTNKVDLITHGRIITEWGNTFRMAGYYHYLRYKGFTSDMIMEELDINMRDYYLQFSSDISSDVKKFAENFEQQYRVERKQNDWQIIQHLMHYYQKNNFIYTVNPGVYDNHSGMSEFLFERKRGFCEHYASTTALLLRLMGIPSRIVTGFQGGVYNNIGDYYIIRGEDAHAWVEAWIPEKGWVTIDPVRFIAPERIESGAEHFFSLANVTLGINFLAFFEGNSSRFFRTIRFTVDSFYYRFNQLFLTYDLDVQKNFFHKIKIHKNAILMVIVVIFFVVVFYYLFKYKNQSISQNKIKKINKKITHYFLKQGIIIESSDGYLTMIEKLELIDDDMDKKQLIRNTLFKLNRMVYDPEFKGKM